VNRCHLRLVIVFEIYQISDYKIEAQRFIFQRCLLRGYTMQRCKGTNYLENNHKKSPKSLYRTGGAGLVEPPLVASVVNGGVKMEQKELHSDEVEKVEPN